MYVSEMKMSRKYSLQCVKNIYVALNS